MTGKVKQKGLFPLRLVPWGHLSTSAPLLSGDGSSLREWGSDCRPLKGDIPKDELENQASEGHNRANR